MKLRFILSPAADGAGNMALDEALFNAKLHEPEMPACVRVYTWDKPCITIGYFQKHAEASGYGLAVTRRMTGGLTVLHGADISFSFVFDEGSWKYVYDQEETYRQVHSTIKSALASCGLETEFVTKEQGGAAIKNNICVQTFYPGDLKSKTKKIVGSCQRRRGKTLLVQGSIHVPATLEKQAFCSAWKNSLAEYSGAELLEKAMTGDELTDAGLLKTTKYGDVSWNKKY